MPRLRYIDVEPLGVLPQIVRGVVTERVAARNLRTQSLVQGVLRDAPRAVDPAGALDHEGDHPSWHTAS